MHANIQSAQAALRDMGLPSAPIEGFDDALIVPAEGRRPLLPFVWASTPFNPQSVGAICGDKAAVHALLKGAVPMPETRRFLDSEPIESIVDATADMGYPRIVKMNSGARSLNVYFIENENECRRALKTIFDKRLRGYDYIALVQEFIDARKEWRVAISAGEPTLAYAKGTFEIAPADLSRDLSRIASVVVRALGMSWGAVDVLESVGGELYFLEANTRPGYAGFVSAHGYGPIRDLYKKALKRELQGAPRSWVRTVLTFSRPEKVR
ncbi:MAG: hypothetical protein KGI79_02745 [Patescibacteria group bacterium]|nr:hypothetical protein [Patescibacteria group bacterium]MDE2116768.1 hypothetical protein [Patescibacteria group bacterium]